MLSSGQSEKGDTDEEQGQEHAHNFLLHQKDITENSSWQSKQSVPHTAVTFYGDCLKICEDFAPNFGDKRTGCYVMTTHRLTLQFSLGNFGPKTKWLCSPVHPIFLCFAN
jgi:hypothetical protein